MSQSNKIYEVPDLRDRSHVFRDRAHAGEVLAGLLSAYRDTNALVFAIPAGGVPVAAEVAPRLNLTLDVAVVSKILLPWNTEAGYGAVAFDGTAWVNNEYVARYGLSAADVQEGTREAKAKVKRRLKRFRAQRPFPTLKDRPVILVDDGLASGSTMRVAVLAVRKQGAGQLMIAVPTGHEQSLERSVANVDALYCANIRGGLSFAVAEAYSRWTDVGEDEVAAVLNKFTQSI